LAEGLFRPRYIMALTNYGLEQIVEAYYSYAITDSMKVSFDYQFIANPA
jgi:high affinity Mn2+ porin